MGCGPHVSGPYDELPLKEQFNDRQDIAQPEWIAPEFGFYDQRTHIVWYVRSNERVNAPGTEGSPPCLCVSST